MGSFDTYGIAGPADGAGQGISHTKGSVTLHPRRGGCDLRSLRYLESLGPDHAFRKKLPMAFFQEGKGIVERAESPEESEVGIKVFGPPFFRKV